MGKIRTELHKARALNVVLENELANLRALLRKNNISFNEVKKRASEIPKKITEDVGKSIRNDYSAIETAIKKLNKRSKDYPELKQALIDLKITVPKRYAISKKDRVTIIDAINDILGINRSDR